jgi:hypothetical protein
MIIFISTICNIAVEAKRIQPAVRAVNKDE